jgi:diketogulonate reductase-like aldo/keto reductase
LIGRVIAGQRDRVFLVSKVEPTHVMGEGIARACDASLGRLGTDHLDLYLLHWPSRDTELSAMVAAFESLRAAGKIRVRIPGRPLLMLCCSAVRAGLFVP